MSERSEGSSAAAARSARTGAPREPYKAWAWFPSLHLLVWADKDGMNLKATIHRPQKGGQSTHETIAKATWHPSEVTELSVVDWGQRALVAWLEEQYGDRVELPE